MTTRRPLQPLSPRSPNIVGAQYSFTHSTHHGTNGFPAMNDANLDDVDALGDDFSLTSKDAEDDFERQMLQNARDERRLHNAQPGRVQAFRKARTHPRVGVTLENLERHNATSSTRVKLESPPSSSESIRSGPAVQPPATWARKGRIKRNWMRTIIAEDEQTPIAQAGTTSRNADADAPRASVEDSPLSHKTSRMATPISFRPQTDDWDFDLNEVSLIASTPYLPRNPALDEIRQREIESLRDQGVTKNQLNRIRETSPEERRTSTKPVTNQENGTELTGSPERRARKHTIPPRKDGNKSSITAGDNFERSPITVYKSSAETDRGSLGNAEVNPKRPAHRREDSHALLRRLARVSSNTPSPARNTTAQPDTPPTNHRDDPSSTFVSGTTPMPPSVQDRPPEGEGVLKTETQNEEAIASAAGLRSQQERTREESESHVVPAHTESHANDVDATPLPVERSILSRKTPRVVGAWIDTPRHVFTAPLKERRRSPSKSPPKDARTKQLPRADSAVSAEEEPQSSTTDRVRPSLPGSALEAIVGSARANADHHTADFGDSTINSLEDLITAYPDDLDQDNPDEDTLQGLQIPTGVPKTEAERRRQQETLQLFRMNERLRTARTSIRDASRGIRRVENRVEHAEDGKDGRPLRVVRGDCPCAINGGHQCEDWTVWKVFKSIFYDERLKSRRRGWGLTIFSIALIMFLTWLVLENTACEIWCHHEYASSYKGYGITWNAPEYPYVIPTVLYRTFVKPWWRPLWIFTSFTCRTLMGQFFGSEEASRAATSATASRVATRIFAGEEDERILGMGADEFVR